MKKTIQSLSLLLFAALLFGCSVPGPQQEGKGAADLPPLTAIPTKEEWAELLQNAEEEEKKELQSQLQSLLWEVTEEELFQVLEGSLEDWAESQQLLDVERISLELTADPLLMDEQTGQRMYANRTAQVDLVFAGEKEAAAQSDLPSQIQQQLVQAVHNTLEGTFSLHTLSFSCRSSADGLERYSGSVGLWRSGSPILPFLPQKEKAMQEAVFRWVQQWNQQEFSGDRFNPHGNVTLRRFGLRPKESELYIEIPIYEVDYKKNVELFRNNLSSQAFSLFQVIEKEPSWVSYLQENGIHQVTILLETPWDPQGQQIHSFPLEEAS